MGRDIDAEKLEGVKDAGSQSVIAIEANRRDGSVLALAHNNEPDSFRAQTATPGLRGTGI
jgi:hypothetical protein